MHVDLIARKEIDLNYEFLDTLLVLQLDYHIQRVDNLSLHLADNDRD